MSDFLIDGRIYNGSLLTANLLSEQQTLVLSSFGGSQQMTLTDESGKLTVGETFQLDGADFTMLGSGTAQPGVNVLGLTVPLGTAQDVIIVQNQATGELHFLFPGGEPNALGMVAMVIDASATGYDLGGGVPLCFGAGTRIETEDGPVAVEQISPGTRLPSPMGPPLTVLASLPLPASAPVPMLVRFGAGSLAPTAPHRMMVLSSQHRIALSGPHLDWLFGLEVALAAAGAATVRQGAGFLPPHRAVSLHHLLCDRHGLIMAEGVPCETLLWGPASRASLGRTMVAALEQRFPELTGRNDLPCLPVLHMWEARMALRLMPEAVATASDLPAVPKRASLA